MWLKDLQTRLNELKAELLASKEQRIRELRRHPEQEELLEESYDTIDSDLVLRIRGVEQQIQMNESTRKMLIHMNRTDKTAMDVFDDILRKEHLDRRDLEFIIDQIIVYEDHIQVNAYCGGEQQSVR